MPANRFAPDRIVRGAEQDARIIDRILQAILARWPIKKCDVESVHSAAIDWTDGAVVPTDNINVDEIFNDATGIVRSLGCMDLLNGLEVGYVDGTTLSFGPGHVLHRGKFKSLECDASDDHITSATVGLVDTTECAPVEGNPSGLDADKWYYVYINMDVSGSTVSDMIRITEKVPVKCEAKGWEHPTNEHWRFIGSIRTMDTGVIRSFDRYNNGWVSWRFAAAKSDYQTSAAFFSGTNGMNASGGWVRYEEATTGQAYHDADKHISPVADFCRVATNDGDNATRMNFRSVLDDAAGEGYESTESGDNSFGLHIPVNQTGIDAVDAQTFYWKDSGNNHVDVMGYHERLQ